TYTVRRGDVLSVIAQRIYGKSALWRLIYEENRDTLDSPEDLREGQVLRIPPSPAEAAPPPPIPGAPGEGRIHVVQDGEYLSTIAQRYYGNARPSTLQMLYEANRDRMRSPDDLDAGTRLLIPELPR
ncbi:MAG: LysM peptidoglycan-binding domain-containing protein, partial [Planctomycetes bacterium]|nr:LysM peptidoglycan-binding domain-containing protein [Planctomycetota bacterium]